MQISDFFAPSPSLRKTLTIGLQPQSGHVDGVPSTIALFIIHVYMGTAMERGAFGSVIRGDVSRAWADHHHHSWYQQLLRNSTTQK